MLSRTTRSPSIKTLGFVSYSIARFYERCLKGCRRPTRSFIVCASCALRFVSHSGNARSCPAKCPKQFHAVSAQLDKQRATHFKAFGQTFLTQRAFTGVSSVSPLLGSFVRQWMGAGVLALYKRRCCQKGAITNGHRSCRYVTLQLPKQFHAVSVEVDQQRATQFEALEKSSQMLKRLQDRMPMSASIARCISGV